MITTLLVWCFASTLLCVWLARHPPKPLRGSVVTPIATLLAAAIALTTGALAAALRTYTALTLEAPIATIACEPAPGQAQQFRAHYTPLTPPGPTQTFDLRGDQWMVSGDFLKWHPWLQVLGFRPVHKPTRLSGRFSQASRERSQPPTVYDLNGGTDVWWTWLHHHGAYLPFVEAVYGAGAYTFADPGRIYTLYVTNSGYLVK